MDKRGVKRKTSKRDEELSGDYGGSNRQDVPERRLIKLMASEYDDALDDSALSRISDPTIEGSRAKQRKSESTCLFCLAGPCKSIRKRQFLSMSTSCYLCLQSPNETILPMQSFITVNDHFPCLGRIYPEEIDQIRNYKKCLIRYYSSVSTEFSGRKGPFVPVFVEHFNPGKNRSLHGTVDVYPLTEDEFDMAKLTFKRELHGLDKEFIRTKQSIVVLEPSPKNGVADRLPKARGFTIPPDPAYLFIDFALDLSYLHFIEEDESMGSVSSDKVTRNWIKSIIRGITGKNLLDSADAKWYDECLESVKATYPQYDWVDAS